MAKDYKHWEQEKKLIPVMIAKYCRGNHKHERKEKGLKHNELCPECEALKEYALFRLEKCPFKKNKGFCSYCKIHCYKPEYKEQIRKVMKYSGHRMIFSHPIFSFSHVVGVIKHKRQVKKANKEQK